MEILPVPITFYIDSKTTNVNVTLIECERDAGGRGTEREWRGCDGGEDTPDRGSYRKGFQ